MGMLDNWLYGLTRPLRELRSKYLGMKNVKDGLAADVRRLKRQVGIKDKPAAPPSDPNKKG